MSSAPFVYTDVPDNHFDGGANLTKGSGKGPTLAEITRDTIARVADQESAMLDPVATVANLRAADGYVDKATVFCESKGMFYYEGSSAAADDGDLVIKPTAVTGNGRWLRMSDLTPVHRTIVVEKVVTTAEVVALGAVLNGQVDFASVLPAGGVLKGAWIEKGVDWAGGAIATMTASIGISGGDVDRYTTAEDIFTGAGAGNLFAAGVAFDGTEAFHPEGAVTVAINFTSTVANLDQLTAGGLTAKIVYVIPNA